MLAAIGLALTGFALQYPVIHGRRWLMGDLTRLHGYPPSAWWEPIVWPLVTIVIVMLLFFTWLLWPQKKAPKRWRPPMEGD
jgi:uncharacterized iron-regulated membrane protein